MKTDTLSMIKLAAIFVVGAMGALGIMEASVASSAKNETAHRDDAEEVASLSGANLESASELYELCITPNVTRRQVSEQLERRGWRKVKLSPAKPYFIADGEITPEELAFLSSAARSILMSQEKFKNYQDEFALAVSWPQEVSTGIFKNADSVFASPDLKRIFGYSQIDTSLVTFVRCVFIGQAYPADIDLFNAIGGRIVAGPGSRSAEQSNHNINGSEVYANINLIDGNMLSLLVNQEMQNYAILNLSLSRKHN